MGWLILKNYPDFWVGAILYTLTPCIGWYLIFTDTAKGDVPWGIALLPWNIILQVLLMPLYLYILVGRVIPVDISALTYKKRGAFFDRAFCFGLYLPEAADQEKGKGLLLRPV